MPANNTIYPDATIGTSGLPVYIGQISTDVIPIVDVTNNLTKEITLTSLFDDLSSNVTGGNVAASGGMIIGGSNANSTVPLQVKGQAAQTVETLQIFGIDGNVHVVVSAAGGLALRGFSSGISTSLAGDVKMYFDITGGAFNNQWIFSKTTGAYIAVVGCPSTVTTGVLAKFSALGELANSILSESGSTLTVAGAVSADNFLATGTGYTAGTNGAYGWAEAQFLRQAANSTRLSNGTTAQTFLVNQTFTSSSVYKAVRLAYDTGLAALTIGGFQVGINAAGLDVLIHSMDGNGPNKAGGNLLFHAGAGSGSAVGGSFAWSSTVPGGSGSSLNIQNIIATLTINAGVTEADFELGVPAGLDGVVKLYTIADAAFGTRLKGSATGSDKTITFPDLTGTVTVLGNSTTGTGAIVLANTPTLITPVLGVATATSINKLAITAPATAATLTIADGKTFTCSNTLTLTGTDSSSVAFGAGGTVAYASNNLSVFAATTSAQLAAVISDETGGSGVLVFNSSPTLITPAITTSATVTNNLAANTSGDGLVLVNTTAATSGNQRYSSRLRFTGNAFETSGNTSQAVDWIAELVPVQGTAASSNLNFSSQINAGGYTSVLTVQSAGSTGGKVGINTSTPNTVGGGCFEVVLQTTNGNVPNDLGTFTVTNNSGVGAVGYGPRFNFNAETATEGTISQIAAFGAVWEVATAGSVQGALTFYTRNAGASYKENLRITGFGSIICGFQAALATGATDGDLYIPVSAGAPTGDTTDYTGKVPLRWDSINSKLWVNTSGATWKGVVLA